MLLKILPVFVLAVPGLFSANPFQPVISPNGVVNAASYLTSAFPNYGISRGGLFLIFGSALGPQDIVSATFPLPTSDGLAGTHVLISMGGYSAACPVIYTSLTQVAALVPSNAPEGDGSLVVSYQNLASSSVPIHIVRSAFGIFTVNQAGSGPASAQNFISQTSTPANTLITSAHPGQTVTLWGTGLGPVTGDETAGPVPGSLPFLDRIWVGGVPANVRYAGRSGCCAGVDQVAFDIPQGVAGCYVPVAVQTGGVLSNYGTISVSNSGNECDDPLSFRASALATLERNSVLRVGQASLTRSAGLGASLGELSLTASFLSYNTQTLTAAIAPLNPSMGSCYLSATQVDKDGSALPHGAGLDAGQAITASGPTGNLTASGTSSGNYAMPGLPGVLPAGAYQFAGIGGVNVGAFQTNLNVAPAMLWSNAGAFINTTVSTGAPLTVTWTGGDPNGYVAIRLTSANSLYNSSIQCNVPQSPGAFTVPGYLMATVFQSSGTLSLTSVSAAAPFTASGLDAGSVTVSSTTQIQANFQAPAQ